MTAVLVHASKQTRLTCAPLPAADEVVGGDGGEGGGQVVADVHDAVVVDRHRLRDT